MDEKQWKIILMFMNLVVRLLYAMAYQNRLRASVTLDEYHNFLGETKWT